MGIEEKKQNKNTLNKFLLFLTKGLDCMTKPFKTITSLPRQTDRKICCPPAPKIRIEKPEESKEKKLLAIINVFSELAGYKITKST